MSIDEQQFQLPLTVETHPRRSPPTVRSRVWSPASQRIAGIDQVLSTRDVEQITGRHRCTIYRWVCAGTFPAKRAGGGRGWLRSDVERWLNSAE
ncbi:MAG TPA: helix-turn-helix domain-containing protein [Steroidobacteraceae bacterium]|nr:helix-turn-helix domain-containing protein [Steroidobacteraceae bacterium]